MINNHFDNKFLTAVKTLVPFVQVIPTIAAKNCIGGYHITDGTKTFSVQFKSGNYAAWDHPVSIHDYDKAIDYPNIAYQAEIAVWDNSDNDFYHIAPYDDVIGYLDVKNVLFWLTDVFIDGFRVYNRQ